MSTLICSYNHVLHSDAMFWTEQLLVPQDFLVAGDCRPVQPSALVELCQGQVDLGIPLLSAQALKLND